MDAKWLAGWLADMGNASHTHQRLNSLLSRLGFSSQICGERRDNAHSEVWVTSEHGLQIVSFQAPHLVTSSKGMRGDSSAGWGTHACSKGEAIHKTLGSFLSEWMEP